MMLITVPVTLDGVLLFKVKYASIAVRMMPDKIDSVAAIRIVGRIVLSLVLDFVRFTVTLPFHLILFLGK